ncbi:MAG: ribbon-helix-helix protein, CopG family [Deltaproteobacteria bacterium]|nr:ribbon-helix-helix protein, CopG family [Deltaproteobacteria bacterium]
MAKRTTIILSSNEERALREASRKEGVSQSELIRRGIRTVTAAYRARSRPLAGWLRLSEKEKRAIRADEFGDDDA